MTWLWPSLLGLSCIVQPDTILRWHRVGFRAYWRWKSRGRPPPNWDAFVQGLREAGYMEGRNIAFEHRSAHDQPELFPKLALELANLKVDVIFARGTWGSG
jgi:hypothetical protein